MFKFRNYDPQTGAARKHARTDEDDTVEKQVEGLAEKIIAEDEAKRAQELVSRSSLLLWWILPARRRSGLMFERTGRSFDLASEGTEADCGICTSIGPYQHPTETSKLGPEARLGSEGSLLPFRRIFLPSLTPCPPAAEQLAKLKTKTDTAISTLIRQRLNAQKGGDSAAASLASGLEQGLPGAADSDSDDDE